MTIEREVYLTKDRYIPPITVTYGSEVQIDLKIMDMNINNYSGNEDIAFSYCFSNGKVYQNKATITNNVVSIVPAPGFFLPGRCQLQALMLDGAKTYFPVPIEVTCHINHKYGNVSNPDNIKTYAERAEAAERKTQELVESFDYGAYEDMKQRIDNAVIVSKDEPDVDYNKIWVDTNVNRIGVPSAEAFLELKQRVDNGIDESAIERKAYEATQAWLNAHPDATTSVKDNSLELSKLTAAARGKIAKKYTTAQEAIADKSLTAYEVVETAGFYTAYDGGAATYIVWPEAYQYAVGMKNGLRMIPLGELWAGALGVHGDGVTDDSERLQNAIRFAMRWERPLHLRGKMLISEDVYIVNSAIIEGESINATQILLTQNACIKIQKQTSENTIYEVRLKNFSIKGQDQSDYCLYADHISQVFIEDCYFDHAKVAAVYTGTGSILFFDRCYFYYSPTGFVIHMTNNVNFKNCNWWDVGTCFMLTRALHVTALSCWFEKFTRFVDVAAASKNSVYTYGCHFIGYEAAYLIGSSDKTDGLHNDLDCLISGARINFGTVTSNALFRFNATGKVQIAIENCALVLAASVTSLVAVDRYTGAVENFVVSVSGTDHTVPTLSDKKKATEMGMVSSYNGTAKLDYGMILGKNIPVSLIANMPEGFIRYNQQYHRVQVVTHDDQDAVEVKYLAFMGGGVSRNKETTPTLTGLQTTLNELINVLAAGGTVYIKTGG